jgi:hypothetical protein
MMKPLSRFDDMWPEYLVSVFIILGILLGVLMRVPTYSYISVILIGFLIGRIYYEKHLFQRILAVVLCVVAFVFSYILANFGVSRFATFVLLVGSIFGSYYLHSKKIFTIFKSKDFLK